MRALALPPPRSLRSMCSRPQWSSNVLDKSSEAKAAIVALGRRSDGTDNRKSMFAAAARAAGITWRQAKSLFYGEPVHPALAEKVRAAADAKAQKEARDDYRALLARIERLETALRLSDEEFHRPSIDGYRGAARGADRAVD